ncbi:hypothetical protein [Salinisphaera shabanensis]|uniref:hypothetical protein n=1 Tax=Salinisphaera shabanensis TaxID=180542 RepID=UPI00333E421C
MMFQTMRYRFLHHLSVAVLLGLIGLLPANAWAQDASDTNVELLLLGTKGGPALLTPKRISQSSALIVDDCDDRCRLRREPASGRSRA